MARVALQNRINQLNHVTHALEWDRDNIMPEKSARERAEVLKTLKELTTSVSANQRMERDRDAGTSAYEHLEGYFAELSKVGTASEVLGWLDSAHPEGAPEISGEMEAVLEGISHELLCRKDMKALLDEADKDTSLTEKQQRNLSLMRREWVSATALDQKLVEDLAVAGNACNKTWIEARKTNDFASYAPAQQAVLDLTREKAKRLGKVLGLSPYDALMDQFSPGLRLEKVNRLFDDLKGWLPEKIQTVQAQNIPSPPLNGNFPKEAQKELGEKMAFSLGFNSEAGRLDTSAHPFSCGITPNDVRITTRYDVTAPLSSLMGVMHESGHGLYSQNVLQSNQPVDGEMGMDVHESQSLTWENMVGRSPEFVRYLLPFIQDAFKDSGVEWTEEMIYQQVNEVQPGLIRVEADEVTYPMHVVLRTEIEQKLISGEMDMVDVPAAWNKGMKDLLGVDVPSDAQGCMQDVHWTSGSFGYFPAYTLGALGAAQLMEAAQKEIPNLKEGFAKGEFKPLLDWLRKNIHEQGCQHEADDLFERVTGKPLGTEAYKKHVAEKFLKKEVNQERSFAERVRPKEPQTAARGRC